MLFLPATAALLASLQIASADGWSTWGSLNFQKPTRLYRMAFWNFNWWQYWTAEGLALERAEHQLARPAPEPQVAPWRHHAGQLGGVYCDRCARGGPALMSANLSDLFRLPAGNTFLLKASYWMNR